MGTDLVDFRKTGTLHLGVTLGTNGSKAWANSGLPGLAIVYYAGDYLFTTSLERKRTIACLYLELTNYLGRLS
jgi:hypothetical protein